MSQSEPWRDLAPGDAFSVRSFGGNAYDAVLILAGATGAGLYVRRNGRLGRIAPSRIDWATLRKLPRQEPLLKDDRVLLVTEAGVERRGRLLEPPSDRLVLGLAGGEVFSAPVAHVAPGSFRLLFAATDLCPGDEFSVKSLSGREHRGVVRSMEQGRVVADLVGSRESVAVRLAQLDLTTLEVLIPFPLQALAPSR